jgi:DNA-binding NtrC family response regulator
MEPILLLLIEDDPDLLDVLSMALTDGGYCIVSAASGAEAITTLDNDIASIRAVITDIRLGAKPDGWEVARHARALSPETPIVYTTGDSAHEWASKGVPKSVVLSKPFSAAQLITAVSTLLNEADTNRAG